jgi:hypothetical protein
VSDYDQVLTEQSEVLVAMIRDVTSMDDGRRITYYYSAPATDESTGTPVVSDTGEAEEQ